jgi:hypothetical protein
MGTRLNLCSEAAESICRAVIPTGLPFGTVANKAMRLGLDKLMGEHSEWRYLTIPRPMGLKPGLSYENVDALSEDI